jgi:hypothetical protein
MSQKRLRKPKLMYEDTGEIDIEALGVNSFLS